MREVSPDAKYSTKMLGRPQGAGGCRRWPPHPPRRSAPSAQWLGLDDYNGTLYRKSYTLQGVGDKIEVWVADDTSRSRPATAAARASTDDHPRPGATA